MLAYGEDAVARLADTNMEVAGFLDCAKRFDWELEHIVSAAGQPGGRVTSEALDAALLPVLRALREAERPYDGILLALHGAMATERDDDGESEILRAIRQVVGDATPIAVTLDLHANVSPEMCRLADIMIS